MNQPNIVLVHWHDLGTRLGCYGHGDVASPRLDALAEDGLRFDAAFCTTPLCTPARASLFTGLYPPRHGHHGLAHRGSRYREGIRTLPMLLGELGYRTALAGMQHEAVDPKSIGFDEVMQVPGGGQFCGPVTDLAEDWLARQPTDAPYFLTVGFTETHRDYEKLGSDQRDERQPDQDELDRVIVPGFLPDNEHTRTDLAWMSRSIARADAATGRVIDAVRARPDADNTLIIFTTDHGMPFPRAKSTLYDSGIRIALIMVPPPAWQVGPSVVDQLLSHVDLTPTLVDLAGGTCDVDGVSHAGLLRGEPVERRPQILSMKDLHEIYDPMRTLRTERHKYIRNLHPGPRLILSTDLDESPTRAGMSTDYRRLRDHEELYDLQADPDEQHNLAADPASAELLATLRDQLAQELATLGDAAVDAWSIVEQPDPNAPRAALPPA